MNHVWIVDDHAVIRAGLKQILNQEGPDIQVSEEASSVQELFSLLKTKRTPDALVLDLSMPGQGGLEAIGDLKSHYPNLPILVLSMHPEDQYALRCLKAGASGYLSKECAPEKLSQALKLLISGRQYITDAVAQLLAKHLKNPQHSSKPHETLSDREFQILILLAKGHTLTEIGESFFLSVKTISTYRARLLKKMNMKTNAELIQYALSNNLL